ncbi:DUF3592 domain-containing protein [Pseudomonadota bacterium]
MRSHDDVNSVRGTKGSKKIGGTILGLFFLLPAIGFLFFSILPNLYDWARMSGWQQVDAQLISSNLESHRGDDSTTYKVVGEYRYLFAGREFRGRRIGISGGSDNIGDWHQETHRALHRRPFRVWVNPGDPSEAVFDPGLRWELLGFKSIFILVFGMVGGGIIWVMGRSTPDAPTGVPLWQWDPRWRENRIRSNAKAVVGASWFFAIIWNAISAPAAFAVPGELAKGNHLILVALLFPLVGMGLLAYAVKSTLAWRRFGKSYLSLNPFPGSIGGDVGGTVELALAREPDSHFKAELTCQHVYTTRSGNKRETRRSVVWQDEQPVELEPGMRGSRVRFCFNTPEDLPSSTEASSDYHEWSLRLVGDLPGVDLDRTFDIPVFADGAPKQSTISVSRVEVAEQPIPESVLSIRQLGDGVELYYPPFRSAGIGFMLLVMGLIFGGVPGFFIITGTEGPPMPMMIIFGFVGISMLLGGLYKLGNSLSVMVTGRGLHVVRKVFGFPFETRLAVAEIRGIDKRIGWQQSQGTQTKAMYQIQVRKRDGGTMTIGDSLPNASAAELVLDRISGVMGHPSTTVEDGAAIPPDLMPGEMLERGRQIARFVRIGANLVGLIVFAYFLLDFGVLEIVKGLFD